MESNITNNKDRNRFEISVDEHTAFIDYIYNPGKKVFFLTHTEVPTSLEGRGIGTSLITQTFEIIKDMGAEVAPICPFVIAYLKRNPQWRELLAEDFRPKG
jgi:predicted GNAT family acetyltransferase